MDANAERRRTQRPPTQPPGPEPPLAAGMDLPNVHPVRVASHSAPAKHDAKACNANKQIEWPVTIAEENSARTPSAAVDLKRLTAPTQRSAPIAPRGSFSFFPIGDLALVAPVELPLSIGAVPDASPNLVLSTRELLRPNPQTSTCASHSGMATSEYECEGRPQFSGLTVTISESGFPESLSFPLLRPGFRDPASVIARQSEVDELLRVALPTLLSPRNQVELNVGIGVANLKSDFLSGPVRVVRNGGAQMVVLAPPRPTAFLAASPEVPTVNLTIPEPDWRRNSPLPIPGLKPSPKNHLQLIKEITPWFVPSRPKPPVLSLDVMPEPRGWQQSRQGFVANPVQLKIKPELEPVDDQDQGMDLSALATALDDPLAQGNDRRKAADSPWPSRRRLPVITPIADWWMTCSNQVKVMVIALPLLCVVAIKPFTHVGMGAPSMEERPSAPVRSAHTTNTPQTLPEGLPTVPADFEARVQKVTKSKLESFKRAVASRAAVEMADDFQSGLDNWEGNGQLGPSWSYDRTGFIRPRALGIYSPSMPLADYAFEFLGKIDQRAISWVFRASDLNNYYVMKLVDKTGGSTPQMALVHYAVIEGREGPKKEVPLPISVYKDTLFRIRMDIQGPHFSVQVQGTVVDYWKDTRLKAGGVGFFTGRGEESRVRWVQVTHQDDALGKLCAFLAPYAM